MAKILVALAVVVVAAAAWLAFRPSDDGGGGGSVAEECEQAYDESRGNAATSDRSSWVADCIAETEAINAGR